MKWSETEFERVARGTRLSDRSRDACRDVLVHGVSPGVAAREHKMFAAQVSRSLGTLRDKQAEMQLGAQTQIDNNATLKLAAELLARAIMGDGTLFFDPSAGQKFEGPILAVQHGFAIQKIGRYAALHDLGRLTESPKIANMLAIAYPADGGRATMVDLTVKTQEVGPGVGR